MPASVAGWGDMPLAGRAAAGDDDRRRRRSATPARAASRPDALRRRGDDGLRHRGLHRLPHDPRLRRRQPLQLPPRRPADQRRDLDPAREQGARRHPQGHERACRSARARRAAWSTSSSSGRSTRRCARRSSSGASAAACSARSTSASASASTTPSAFASTPAPSTSTRSSATRAATATCSRSPATGAPSAATLIEAEVETSHRSQPSVPGFSLLGDTRAGGARPARSTSTTSRGRCRWCSTRRPGRCASRRSSDDRLARRRRTALMQRLRTDDRDRLSVRLHRPEPPPTAPTTPTASARTATSTSTTFAARTSRAAAARSTSRCTARRPRASWRTHVQPGRAAHGGQATASRTDAFNFAGTGNVDGTLRHAARARRRVRRRPIATSARPSSRCATPSPSAAAPTAWLGARHTQLARSATPTDGHGQRDLVQPVVHHAVRRAQPGVRAAARSSTRAGARASRATSRRTCRSTPATPPVPRYSNAGQALPAAESRQVEIGLKGGAEHARVERGGVRHPPPALRRHRPATACGVVQCTRGLVGDQRHRGVEGSVAWRARRLGRARRRAMAARAHRRARTTRRSTASGRPTCPPSRRACRPTTQVPRAVRPAPARRRQLRERRARCCPTTASRSRA